MAAYIIVEVETTDEALMAEYRKHTPGAIAKFGGKFIVRGGKTKTLEGGWTPPRVVVLEFPSYEKAEEFYYSDHYKPILAMRLKAGKSKAILVDGNNG
ncbi:MAG: D-fructose-6-phosphate amidotransferase [Alphaproteobacteria bacterium RIFCSPHIGHO2_12_FULL_66_14]|nr:MAG: D-fructose-6-phosphate amidotransferase [Alphaproteobacteria bacterium RIFCSPHIGHO2_12_FULL_66_14]